LRRGKVEGGSVHTLPPLLLMLKKNLSSLS
jgi:hypothetical protein